MPKVRELALAVLTERRDEVVAALSRAATNPKTVLMFLEQLARLNKELGPGSPTLMIVSKELRPGIYQEAVARQAGPEADADG
jgi:hypothetical protein